MQILGTIYGTTHTGNLVVQARKQPFVYRRVFDRRKNEIGKIVHVFGNVESPYAVIRPYRKNDILHLMGKEVFMR